MWKAIVNLMG